MPEREGRLVEQGSPCDTNFYDLGLLTIEQARERGRELCLNYRTCTTAGKYCAMRAGLEVARYVLKAGEAQTKEERLRKEMHDFSQADFIDGEFFTSLNRREFEVIRGRGKVLRAVERFARVVLFMNPFESIYPLCEKCGGARIYERVHDSIHDGPFPLSGSGRTRARGVEYCPDCDPKPRGKILDEDPEDAREIEILRRIRKANR